MSQEIIAFIPIDFFSNGKLNPFNCEIKKGGAFILRAVVIGDDGQPLRPKEYVFFTNGMFSLAFSYQGTNLDETMLVYSGFQARFTKKGSFWEVRGDKKMYYYKENVAIPSLRVAIVKPQGKEVIILSGITRITGQYIYLQ